MDKSKKTKNEQNNNYTAQNKDKSQDTSLPGREEQIVNNEGKNRRSNSDIGDSTNLGKTSTGNSDFERNSSSSNMEIAKDEDQKTKISDKERSYKQGMEDNDNRNSDLPDIGREDAERTSRETPRM